MKIFFKITTFFILLICVINISAQQTDKEKAIELYKTGNNAQAIFMLKQRTKEEQFKNDEEIWNYLGLAYLKNNQLKDGRKALEKATKLSPQNSAIRANLAYAYLLNNKVDKARDEADKAIQLNPQSSFAFFIRGTANFHEGKYDKAETDADRALKINQQFTAAYALKADSLLYNFGRKWQETSEPRKNLDILGQADKILQSCLVICPKNSELQAIYERVETVKAFSDYFNRTEEKNDSDAGVDANKTPLQILSKPKANYTDRARQSNVQGVIRLAVLFGVDGQIKSVFVLSGLAGGLTEEAVIAAGKIKFEPEKINGRPVPVVKIVEYGFSIY